MLQAPCYSQPLVYGHSHFKKFWLRQTESEDDAAFATQHVTSCSQKFSALSSPISSSMAGPGQSNTPCCNASLAACANSFSAPRSPSVDEAGSGMSKEEFNYEFEALSEAGVVDCTLSLGTGKRDGSETPTGLSRSGSPAQDVFKPAALFPSKAQWQAVALDAQVNFIRECPSDCIRDIYPQSAIPLRLPRIGGAQTCLDNSRFRNLTPDNISYDNTGSPVREAFIPAKKSVVYAVDDVSDVGAPDYLSEEKKDPPRAVPSRLARPTVLIPSGGVPESKYGDVPSLTSAGVASPASGQSSVNGEERSCPQRSTDLELTGSGASYSRSVGRTCAHCGTMKTPLWRNGPQGPKSLCNACGIRFKKAGKRNSSNGNSSELPGSLPSSPVSVKLSPGKSSKRKTDFSVSRESCLEAGVAAAKSSEQVPNVWKRNRLSGGRGSFESSGSEGDETAGSSGTSCVTCPPRAKSTACIVPVLSVPLVPDRNHPSLTRFLPIEEAVFPAEYVPKASGSSKIVFAQDEEEGAKLLMALSCGLVNA